MTTVPASKLHKGHRVRVMIGRDGDSVFAVVNRVREGSMQELLLAGQDDRPATVVYLITDDVLRHWRVPTRGLTLHLSPDQPVKTYPKGR